MVVSVSRPRLWGMTARRTAAFGGGRSWRAERGNLRWGGKADVAGAFPGFASNGGFLLAAGVRLTDRLLLVAEGEEHGFGLPLAAIVAVRRAEREGPRPDSDRVWIVYEEGGDRWRFAIQPRRAFLRRPSTPRLLAALAALDHVPEQRGAAAARISWDEARRFQNEPVVWTGRQTVGDGDSPSLRGDAADLWLTSRSLLWARPDDRELCSLVVDRIRSVSPTTAADRATTPGIVVVYDDDAEQGIVAIWFDREGAAERNRRDRDALLAGLCSCGAPLASGPERRRPRRGPLPVPAAPGVRVGAAGVAEVRDRAEVPEPMPAEPLVETAHGVATPRTAAVSEAPIPDLPQVRRYEAAALTALAEARRRIALGRPAASDPAPAPSAAALAGALAELDAALAADALSPATAAARRARLLALHEVGPRLRALVELRDHGYLSTADLERKRRAILAPLARIVFP